MNKVATKNYFKDLRRQNKDVKHMWLMIGHKSDKCDMRVLRVPVTWFLYFCPKIPTPDPCDMRDMRDMRFADL